jgi:hypothetical protein
MKEKKNASPSVFELLYENSGKDFALTAVTFNLERHTVQTL